MAFDRATIAERCVRSATVARTPALRCAAPGDPRIRPGQAGVTALTACVARALLVHPAVDNRRSFFTRIAMWVALVGSCGTAAAMAVRYLVPVKRPRRERSVYVARIDEIPDGGTRVVEDLRGARVQVVRQGQRVLALSMVCPHLGCQVRWDGDQGRFGCPCHAAAFDTEGRVLFGPPPRGLDRYDVELQDGCIYLKLTEPSSAS